MGSRIGDWYFGFRIGIGDWELWIRIGVGDWSLGLRIGDWDWGLGLGIGNLRMGLGIGRMTNDNDFTLQFVLMRMKFILFLSCFFEGCVVAGLMKN